MPRPIDRPLGWMVGMAVVSLLATVGLARAALIGAPHHASQPLPSYRLVPPFSLNDQHGRVVTRQDVEGHVWIADFIFTSCPGQCPLMTEQMRALERTFAHDEDLRFVSFSVDPSHDTPEVLAAYAARFGADHRWTFLTGAREAILQLCHDGFQLAVEDNPASSHEPITHSVRMVLVDRRGTIRGYYDATDAQPLARLRHDTQRLLQEHP